MERITSAQNPKIKALQSLQAKSAERREQNLFVVEGCRELQHCIDALFEVRTVFHCPEICPSLPAGLCEECIFEVSPAVYDKIAYRGGTEGVIACIRPRALTFENLEEKFALKANPLVIVLEAVEKPGNLGAVLRSADAAGADAVLVCDPLTDLYNPNLIRSSIGAVFTVPVLSCTSQEAIEWLQKRSFSILTAQLQDSSLYYETDMTGPTAIVMGAESTGLTDIWRKAATAHIRIPMLGRLDSLNVSVSAAILLFEAVRQRR